MKSNNKCNLNAFLYKFELFARTNVPAPCCCRRCCCFSCSITVREGVSERASERANLSWCSFSFALARLLLSLLFVACILNSLRVTESVRESERENAFEKKVSTTSNYFYHYCLLCVRVLVSLVFLFFFPYFLFSFVFVLFVYYNNDNKNCSCSLMLFVIVSYCEYFSYVFLSFPFAIIHVIIKHTHIHTDKTVIK